MFYTCRKVCAFHFKSLKHFLNFGVLNYVFKLLSFFKSTFSLDFKGCDFVLWPDFCYFMFLLLSTTVKEHFIVLEMRYILLVNE